MPDMPVRRRWGHAAMSWRRGLDRWFHRHRPKIAVAAAFSVACLMGLAASAGLHGLAGGR